MGPRSCYDEAKRFGEAMTGAYSRRYGLDVRIARIFNTYGERMNPSDGRVVSAFITQALQGCPLTVYGDGTQTRSFCHVSDQVAGLEALLDADYDRPVNIGNPEEISVAQLAAIVVEAAGSSSEIHNLPLPDQRVGDPLRRCPDIALARSVLRWEPKVSLRDGVLLMVDHFREHEDL